MRTLSFLLITFLCVQTPSLFTVMLKSGRTVQGIRISEDSQSVQIKDANGLVLSFRKTMLDLDAMDRLNKTSEPAPKLVTDPPLKTSKTLVEIANETKNNRKGSARVLTNQDLAHAPEITILGASGVFQNDSRDDRSSVPSKEERYWRETANDLREDISRLQERRISVETSCERARDRKIDQRTTPHKTSVDFFSLYDDPAECKKLHEVDRQLEEAKSRMEAFEDRARQAGIPWQWLE